MKKIFILAIALFLSSEAYSWCVMNRGNTCQPKQKGNSNSQVNIYNGAIGGPSYAKSDDGGFLRRRLAGDKSQNQGYADYKRHFVYYAYEVYSVPHQEGFHKSAETGNRSIGYEYAFNPFISIKGQRTQLFFDGLGSSSEMKHEHLIALLNLRVYVLNDFVVRAGIGMGRSKINAVSSDSDYDFSKEGSTEVVQFSAMYIFGDENTFVGATTTTVQGKSGETNLGTSSYGLNAGIGF